MLELQRDNLEKSAEIGRLKREAQKTEFHKENVIVLPRWEGDINDRELYDILPFLDNVGSAHGSDVRAEIKKYGREGTGKKYLEV